MTGYPWASGDELDASDLNAAIAACAPAVALTNADTALTNAALAQTAADGATAAANTAQTTANAALPLSGGTMTGPLVAPVSPSTVIASGASANRTLADRFTDFLNVRDFGAKGDGITDDTKAIQDAVTYANGKGGGHIVIPPGQYILTFTITSYPNISIIGMDQNATVVIPTISGMTAFEIANAGLTICNSGFCGFTISPTVTGVTGISLTLCRFVQIRDMSFVGCQSNLLIDRGYFFTVQNILSSGKTGLAAGSATFTSTSDTDYVYHATISNYKIINQGTGVAAFGIYMRRAIDFEITDVHAYAATGCDVIIIENDSQGVKIKGLNVAGCTAGVILQQGSGIAVTPTFTSIAASHIDQPTAFGLRATGTIALSLTDVQFTPNTSFVTIPAVSLVGANDTIINGCIFSNFNGTGGAGVQFLGSVNTLIHNNIFLGCNIGVGFSGSVTTATIRNNQFPSTTSPIAGSPAGAGNVIAGNSDVRGTTAFVTISPAMPASTVAYTNNTAFPCRVFIAGGAFSVVTLVGIAIGVTNNTWSGDVEPGDTIAITYTSVPGWWWVGK